MLRDYQGYFVSPEMQRYYQEKRLFSLQLEITPICNQECRFCYTHGTLRAQMMPNAFLRRILDDASSMSVRKIEWLGGDPLTRDDWFELMDYSKKLDLINNIWTAGDLLADKTTAKKAMKATEGGGLISVHFDTFDRSLYKKLHKASPKFIDAVLKGLRNLLDLGKPAEELFHCITFTNLQAGSDFRNSVDRLLDDFGVPTGIVPYKPAIPGFERLIPTSQQIQEALEYKNKRIFEADIPAIPQCVSKYYCGSTAAVIAGDALSPCSRIRTAVGKRIRDSRFKDAFEINRNQLLTTILQDHNNLSSRCQACTLNDICWGCRSNAWYYAGDFLASDPKCWKQAENNEKEK
ncbi:MAG: radical SAM/SPASM domain-containing protein [Candidatus Hodarchaeota archaeon]